ncbi:MAG: ABC transporter ATP-binding protein [Pseudomonadota bacterium]
MLAINQLKIRPSSKPADIACTAGSITVVLGRNQSGKTDLCRLAAGLPTKASGTVTIGGEIYQRKSGPVAMVFQAFVNYPSWTVAGNIASPMQAAGIRDEGRVRELAALVKIEHLLHRMPDELSGGQQQRLAIARALAKKPKVLLMDEPFVNLDFKLREALNAELRTLVEETGVALLFTTSDPSDALALADQLILLESHEVLQQGSALELYRSPVGFAAADLLSDPGINRLSDTQYVRPEHVHLSADSNGHSSTLRAVETNGAQSYLHADVTLTHGTEEWVVKLPGIVTHQAGEHVLLAVDHRDVLELGA